MKHTPADRDPTVELGCPFCGRRVVFMPDLGRDIVIGECEPCDVTITIAARTATQPRREEIEG